MNTHGRDLRRQERRACSLYLRLVNHRTREIVGDIADVSYGGFKLESSKPMAPNLLFTFRMDMPPEITDKPYILFNARSRWCRTDPLDGRLYDIGFEIVAMDPADGRLFDQVFERYGKKSVSSDTGAEDWRRR